MELHANIVMHRHGQIKIRQSTDCIPAGNYWLVKLSTTCFFRITSEILAMARPTSLAIQQFEIIRQFKREKIKTVINLQSLNEHAFCGPPLLPSGFSYDPEVLMKNKSKFRLLNCFQSFKVYYYNFAIPDFGMTNVYSLLDIIKVMWFALKQGKIAVHCHAGLGRTCTLIACYLVWSKGITAEEAIKLVRTRR